MTTFKIISKYPYSFIFFSGVGSVGPPDPLHIHGHSPPGSRHKLGSRQRRRRARICRGLCHCLAGVHGGHAQHETAEGKHLLLPVCLCARVLPPAPLYFPSPVQVRHAKKLDICSKINMKREKCQA